MKTLPQKTQIEFEKINFVYDHLVMGLILNILVGGALFVILWDVSGLFQSVIWYSILAVIVAVRFGILFLYRRSKDKITNLTHWNNAFIIGAFAMGMVWGLGGIILFPPDDVALQILLCFFIGGMVMGAVPYLSPVLPAYLLFLFSAELPINIYLLSFTDKVHVALAAVNVFFVIAMLVAARLSQRNFLQNLVLRFVNQDLVRKLNETNNDLEHKIYLKNKIEEDLRENEHRFKALSNAAHDGVVLHTNGEIIEANEAAARMGGFSVREMIGKSVMDLIAPECRQDIASRLAEPKQQTFETSCLRKDGSTFRAELNGGDVAYQGRQTHIVSVRDISKQKQIETDMLHAKNAAEAADKLKSEFLASVSHELRTPLNAVLGFMQILEESPLNSEQQEYLGMSEKAARQLLLLINDLLDLSRIETGHFEYQSQDVNLKVLVNETIQIMSSKTNEYGGHLSLEIPGQIPEWVSIDPDRVRQVLINLIGNALKFTNRDEGKVRLLVTTKPSSKGKPLLYFEVIDNGIGIPAEKQKAIFQRFTQLDASVSRQYGGAGLGLAISQELVYKMGGNIGVISEAGGGSNFWFTLPCEEVDAPAQNEQAGVEINIADYSFDGLSVLVVEDDETNQIIARHMLERLGCHVDLLVNGQEALETETTYDLIFMDMQMPVLDGLEATRGLRNRGLTTPIVAMTANAMQGDRERCLQVGMNDYVSKPIEMATLAKVLAQWVQVKKQRAS